MTGVRNRVDAFVDWGWDYFTSNRRAAGARPRRRRADRLGATTASWRPVAPRAMTVARASPPSTWRASQFATTSIYHFLFVPLTLGLAPLVAIMQTIWYRTGVDAWLRLTRFFGTLLLINFAIGVATGLVQEFQFGMNWSVYSNFVGGVFGAPLAIEGLAAFMLEATFLGLWIFGWDLLSARVHLATIWIAALGTWLSAYFILVANSWMQRPVGYEIVDGKAQLTDVGALLSNHFALTAWLHTILAGLIFGSMVVLGVSCWHFLRGRNVELFRRAAKLALIVAVPATLVQLSVGNRFGAAVHERAGDEDRRVRGAVGHLRAVRLLGVPDRRVLGAGPGPELRDHDPAPAVVDGHRLVRRPGPGPQPAAGAGGSKQFGPGNYMPRVRLMYWSMRVMAMLGVAMFLIAALGAWLYRRQALHKTRWFLRTAIVAIAFPYIAATAGWILTEMGRQPWIVQDLLKTADAVSPNLSTATIATSLGVFLALYLALGVVDFVLMRRYARAGPAAGRAGRAGLGAGDSASREPGEMGLEEFWFVLIAVLWGGYFLLEGFDFGVGMLLPVLPRDEREREHDVRLDRAGVGRQRGLARRRRRRDVRGVPGLVRDDVLRLLHRAAARPRAADRPRGLVRVTRSPSTPMRAWRTSRRSWSTTTSTRFRSWTAAASSASSARKTSCGRSCLQGSRADQGIFPSWFFFLLFRISDRILYTRCSA